MLGVRGYRRYLQRPKFSTPVRYLPLSKEYAFHFRVKKLGSCLNHVLEHIFSDVFWKFDWQKNCLIFVLSSDTFWKPTPPYPSCRTGTKYEQSLLFLYQRYRIFFLCESSIFTTLLEKIDWMNEKAVFFPSTEKKSLEIEWKNGK